MQKLIVCVEMDRCATDAIQAVTGCSLGRRTLRFFDYGKMAATFINLETHKAVRVVARDDARTLASAYCPEAASPREAQEKAYGSIPENELFALHAASPTIAEENLPGYRGAPVYCDGCGEGIHFRREIHAAGRILCIPCAGAERDSRGCGGLQSEAKPPVLLIVGFKKVGKTRLLENLIKELSSRGYRVACIKHHHSDAPVVVDACGTDTWRFRKAGAQSVVLITPAHIAYFRDTPAQLDLEQVLRKLTAADLVLGEGFHAEPHAKIEVVSVNGNTRLSRTDKNLIALVKTTQGGEAVPTFAPESIKALADFIEAKILSRSRGRF